MAASTATVAGLPSLAVSRQGVARSVRPASGGLRLAASFGQRKSTSFAAATSHAISASRTVCVDAPLVISVSTAGLLALGRFVFLPFQRKTNAEAGLPLQNGVTHLAAGDDRAQEVSAVLKTNDPAGFTIIDVLAWGALGHVVAFFALATASNGYEPTF